MHDTIASPKYSGLSPKLHGTLHLVVTYGVGEFAAASMLASTPPDFRSRTVALHSVAKEEGHVLSSSLQQLTLASIVSFNSTHALLLSLKEELIQGNMGTQLYVAGPEGFVCQVLGCAAEHGMDHSSICVERCGPITRRVQCIHCKGMTEDVAEEIVSCMYCGLKLLVRDHFSRRLGAFMGVRVDAEDRVMGGAA